MSIKNVVKAHCPKCMLPVLRMPYRIATWPLRTARRMAITWRALKYLPYYQDELSREILRDRIEYLKSGDLNIFLKRAVNDGWDLRHYGFRVKSEERHYSHITVVYDEESLELEYTRNLLEASREPESYRITALADFMSGLDIAEDELIVAVGCFDVVKSYMDDRNMHNDLTNWLIINRSDEQYLDVFEPSDSETVIQAGCYDGFTVARFLDWGKGRIRKIYSFEPDPCSFERCRENLRDYGNKVTLINKGLWNMDTVTYADADGSGASSVFSEGSTELKLTSIDNAVKGDAVTFIQLDIEGSELKALEGAKNTIIKNHPKLAICVYHKREDIFEIPGYILSLVPEYKFYLRHYDTNSWETVLYASCE